jgi:hypothetical protein
MAGCLVFSEVACEVKTGLRLRRNQMVDLGWVAFAIKIYSLECTSISSSQLIILPLLRVFIVEVLLLRSNELIVPFDKISFVKAWRVAVRLDWLRPITKSTLEVSFCCGFVDVVLKSHFGICFVCFFPLTVLGCYLFMARSLVCETVYPGNPNLSIFVEIGAHWKDRALCADQRHFKAIRMPRPLPVFWGLVDASNRWLLGERLKH